MPEIGPRSAAPALLLAGLLAGLLTGCGVSLTPEQTQAMGKLQELGARINFKRGGYEVDLTQTPVENKDLVHLQNIPNLKLVDLRATRVTDAGLDHLRPIRSLEIVELARATVSDEGVKSLRKSLPTTDIRH